MIKNFSYITILVLTVSVNSYSEVRTVDPENWEVQYETLSGTLKLYYEHMGDPTGAPISAAMEIIRSDGDNDLIYGEHSQVSYQDLTGIGSASGKGNGVLIEAPCRKTWDEDFKREYLEKYGKDLDQMLEDVKHDRYIAFQNGDPTASGVPCDFDVTDSIKFYTTSRGIYMTFPKTTFKDYSGYQESRSTVLKVDEVNTEYLLNSATIK